MLTDKELDAIKHDHDDLFPRKNRKRAPKYNVYARPVKRAFTGLVGSVFAAVKIQDPVKAGPVRDGVHSLTLVPKITGNDETLSSPARRHKLDCGPTSTTRNMGRSILTVAYRSTSLIRN